jgi:tripartite-type tricarboxylate transporter receptor subunit TctC
MSLTATRRTLLGAGGAALATGVLGRGARASWQPQRPIQIIVGFAAGGGTDVVARAIGTAAQEFFPVPLTIVNRPGAAGTVAAQMVARGPQDGTMLLVSGGSESTSAPNHQQLPYDPRTDFRGVIGIARLPIFLAVRDDSPIRTVGDFVTQAKANPGRVVFASAGVGGLYHSTMIVFGRKAGFEVRHVPYQGGAPALAALVGGHADIAMGSPDEVASLAEAGTIRLIGVASRKRIGDSYAEVPTLIELGYDVFIENMKGLSAPGGTPDEVITYLHERFHRAMQTEQFKTLAARSGMLIEYSDGATFHSNIVTMFNIIGEALRQA